MPRLADWSLVPLGSLLFACSHAPAPEVPTYPELPPAPAAPRATPAEGVETLELTCEREERADGIDDNCNGHIDEGHGGIEGALEFALSWQGEAKLTLQTEPALEGTPQVHCTEAHVCVARLSVDTFPEAPLSVRVQTPAIDAPITASLSVAARGARVGTYNVQLAPDQTTEVVRLDSP